MTPQKLQELIREIKHDCDGCGYWSGKDCTLVSPKKGCDRQVKFRMTPQEAIEDIKLCIQPVVGGISL